MILPDGRVVLSRDPQNGRVTGTSIGNVTETVGYNDFGELAWREVQMGSTTVLLVEYVRDALGRIIERIETIQGETHVDGFAYDEFGRVVLDTSQEFTPFGQPFQGHRSCKSI